MAIDGITILAAAKRGNGGVRYLVHVPGPSDYVPGMLTKVDLLAALAACEDVRVTKRIADGWTPNVASILRSLSGPYVIEDGGDCARVMDARQAVNTEVAAHTDLSAHKLCIFLVCD
jgi:hypothetical protein